MVTRLEIERYTLDKGKTIRSRETLFELEDRIGVHKTKFGDVRLGVEKSPLHRNYGYGHLYNTDIVIDAGNAPDLAERLKAPKRRISVGTDGNGVQQIGSEVTLFVHSDSFRGDKSYKSLTRR